MHFFIQGFESRSTHRQEPSSNQQFQQQYQSNKHFSNISTTERVLDNKSGSYLQGKSLGSSTDIDSSLGTTQSESRFQRPPQAAATIQSSQLPMSSLRSCNSPQRSEYSNRKYPLELGLPQANGVDYHYEAPQNSQSKPSTPPRPQYKRQGSPSVPSTDQFASFLPHDHQLPYDRSITPGELGSQNITYQSHGSNRNRGWDGRSRNGNWCSYQHRHYRHNHQFNVSSTESNITCYSSHHDRHPQPILESETTHSQHQLHPFGHENQQRVQQMEDICDITMRNLPEPNQSSTTRNDDRRSYQFDNQSYGRSLPSHQVCSYDEISTKEKIRDASTAIPRSSWTPPLRTLHHQHRSNHDRNARRSKSSSPLPTLSSVKKSDSDLNESSPIAHFPKNEHHTERVSPHAPSRYFSRSQSRTPSEDVGTHTSCQENVERGRCISPSNPHRNHRMRRNSGGRAINLPSSGKVGAAAFNDKNRDLRETLPPRHSTHHLQDIRSRSQGFPDASYREEQYHRETFHYAELGGAPIHNSTGRTRRELHSKNDSYDMIPYATAASPHHQRRR